MKLIHTLIGTLCMAFCAHAADIPAPEKSTEDNLKLPDYKKLHQLVEAKDKPILWLFLGDSITHGAMHTHGWRSYPEHWQEVIKWEPRKPGGYRRTNDIIVNTAVSGETASGFLKNIDWRLNQFKPQVVFIDFGTNDAVKIGKIDVFKKDLTTIVQQIRRMKAIPVLQVSSPNMRNNPRDFEYSNAVREIAAKEKVLLVDHAAHWKKAMGENQAIKPWMNDNIHPNGLGHRAMVIKLATDLGFMDPSSPTLKMP